MCQLLEHRDRNSSIGCHNEQGAKLRLQQIEATLDVSQIQETNVNPTAVSTIADIANLNTTLDIFTQMAQ